MPWTLWKVVYGLAYSNQVSWMPMSYLAFSSLVGDSVTVSRRCVLTRDWVNEFLGFSHPSYLVSSLGHMCTHDHDLCTFSSHGPHKTASHLQFHIHVSSILTRLSCGTPSAPLPSFPFLPISLLPLPPSLHNPHTHTPLQKQHHLG